MAAKIYSLETQLSAKNNDESSKKILNGRKSSRHSTESRYLQNSISLCMTLGWKEYQSNTLHFLILIELEILQNHLLVLLDIDECRIISQ